MKNEKRKRTEDAEARKHGEAQADGAGHLFNVCFSVSCGWLVEGGMAGCVGGGPVWYYVGVGGWSRGEGRTRTHTHTHTHTHRGAAEVAADDDLGDEGAGDGELLCVWCLWLV